MAEPVIRLALRVDAGPRADVEEVDELTLQLRRELAELEVDSISSHRVGAPPPGARAVDVAALGMLIVTLGRSPEVLGAVVGTIQSWLAGRPRRSVRLEVDGDVLDVTGLSAADQRRLISTWVARHAVPAEPRAASGR